MLLLLLLHVLFSFSFGYSYFSNYKNNSHKTQNPKETGLMTYNFVTSIYQKIPKTKLKYKAIESLPSKCEALSSNSSTVKKKKKKERNWL
jgi:hypothetical protein